MAKEQIKFELPSSDISADCKETLRKVGTGEYSVPKSVVDKSLEAQAQRVMKEGKDKEDRIKEIEKKFDELAAEHEVIKAELQATKDRLKNGPPTNKVGIAFINDLRKQDIPKVNRTCRCCSRRVPLKGMESRIIEFCNDCLSK